MFASLFIATRKTAALYSSGLEHSTNPSLTKVSQAQDSFIADVLSLL